MESVFAVGMVEQGALMLGAGVALQARQPVRTVGHEKGCNQKAQAEISEEKGEKVILVYGIAFFSWELLMNVIIPLFNHIFAIQEPLHTFVAVHCSFVGTVIFLFSKLST